MKRKPQNNTSQELLVSNVSTSHKHSDSDLEREELSDRESRGSIQKAMEDVKVVSKQHLQMDK